MMMLIENLKRLSALTINIDGNHVKVEGSNIEWSGTIDELPEFLNDAAIEVTK